MLNLGIFTSKGEVIHFPFPPSGAWDSDVISERVLVTQEDGDHMARVAK